ncbi:transcriptional regulator [Sedimentitalea sp. CY04]|uniref:Transcriptional regulator n=1 Tax=Parasedimentitalea denitrificans TaxID=2211118 RepID=A0ABX0WBS9_9RHOB|nr:LacI family DNA-binding transcriptional regulator [Sedimentitalea sp. CY04]NIZ62224.1 transcriptional regulator [Sedimentitalea sp. CY04]
MSKPTLVDVGREAGVSAITVSRALRSPEKVSDSLRAKVDNAVRKLGYVPNQSASTLAASKTNSIVVMIPSTSNNVFSDVLRGIDEALKGSRFTLQIGNTGYDPLEEERLLRSFLNPAPAGVILAGIEQTDATKQMLQAVGGPVVQIMDVCSNPIDWIIGFSHEQAARTATEHLITAGYQNIGFIGAQMDPRSQQRLTGFKSALQAKDMLHQDAVAVTNRPSDVGLGSAMFSRLVGNFPDCDAVFCNNDDLALGVLFECQRRGLSVPDQIGICGFNDLGITSQSVPTVTSVTTPLKEIGRLAGEILTKDRPVSYQPVVDLGSILAIRDSTRRYQFDNQDINRRLSKLRAN